MKLSRTQLLIWAALILALIGSLRHVAWAFSTIEGGAMWAGYIQAVAVDLGLVALALAVQERRAVGRSTLALWAGVLAFSGISAYANWLYGHHHLVELSAPLASWRPAVLTAVLPVLVVFLAEIAGSDVQFAAAETEAEEIAEDEARVAEERRQARRDAYAEKRRLEEIAQQQGEVSPTPAENAPTRTGKGGISPGGLESVAAILAARELRPEMTRAEEALAGKCSTRVLSNWERNGHLPGRNGDAD